MKIGFRFILLFAFVVLTASCSRSYNKVTKAVARYDKGIYTRAQVDSVVARIYKIDEHNFLPCPQLKYAGAYVSKVDHGQHKKPHHHVLKFTPGCVGYRGEDIFDLSPGAFTGAWGEEMRYSMQNGELVYELLVPGFLDIFDVFSYGTVSENGDTLTFYKIKGYKRPNTVKRLKTKEVFIYNPDITAIPSIPDPVNKRKSSE